MSNYHKTGQLSEAKAFYTEELLKYKTIASKKAFLTRCAKKVADYLKDITEAVDNGYKRGEIYGWYLGEIFQKSHVRHYQWELDMINELRASII